MAPVLNSNVFKCVMPIFANEMVSSLPGNTKHIIYKLGNTILSSVYNTVEGSFKKGYLVGNAHCNWQKIDKHLEDLPNDLSILEDECNGLKTPIYGITDKNNLILERTVTPYQNGTANIFGQLYKVVHDYMFSQGDITETNGADFLGLNECTREEAVSTLQNHNDYLQSLIPTTTTTTEAPAVALKNRLDSLGDKAYELLKEWGYITAPTPCPTPSPNDDTNDGGYSGAYIAGVAVSILAVGAILGYSARYGWDWYKGRTIKKENLDLVAQNNNLAFVKLLHENFKDNSVILDKIVEIHDLSDVIRIARSTAQYEFSILPLTNLNNEIIKLHSPSAIAMNLNSSSGILHEICKSLNGDDSLNTISDFATLITTIRTANSASNEYKESITKIFEIFNPNYTDIDYQKDYETPLLADGCSPSGSSGVEC